MSLGSMPGDDIAVMTAHVFHRGLDDRHPASLSRAVTTDLLRGELGFEGVIATDSVDMMAVRETMSLLEVSRRAILAGADIIIDGCNGPLGDRASDVARVVHDLTDEAAAGQRAPRPDRSQRRPAVAVQPGGLRRPLSTLPRGSGSDTLGA
jgi:beta-N-acetylhexosaminidase